MAGDIQSFKNCLGILHIAYFLKIVFSLSVAYSSFPVGVKKRLVQKTNNLGHKSPIIFVHRMDVIGKL